MTDYNSVQFAKWESVPPQMVGANEYYGNVRLARFEYTMDTDANSYTVGDRIFLTKVPKGAHILPVSKVESEALGSDIEIKIGYEGSDTALLAFTDFSSSVDTEMEPVDEMSATEDIFATIGETSTLAVTNGNTIKGWIEFVVE